MLQALADRIRPTRRTWLWTALAVAAPVASPVQALALSAVPDCSASGDSLRCDLASVLQLLYVTAGVLLVLLIVALVLAIRTYRKNKENKEVS